jgi:hypothetical protein
MRVANLLRSGPKLENLEVPMAENGSAGRENQVVPQLPV